MSLRAAAGVMRSVGVDIRSCAQQVVVEVPLWRRLQADILGVPIRRLAGPHGAAYGAAIIARVAAGHAPDLEAAMAGIRVFG